MKEQDRVPYQADEYTGGRMQMFGSGILPEYKLSYETYGELNAAKDNAILLFHAMTGSQHALGVREEKPDGAFAWNDECYFGWWDKFIGKGKALDTDKFFVICANYIGGCYGSTGPFSINPATGTHYGSEFPEIRICDIADSQIGLLDQLGIDRLHAVIGGSLGGMLAVSLATRFPERVNIVVPIASGVSVPPLQRLIIFEQIYAIETDKNFLGGNYYHGQIPTWGLTLARMISHKTFVSLETLENRASRGVKAESSALSWYNPDQPVESYMLHQGNKFVHRFDPNSYLRILDAWQKYDPLQEAGVESFHELFRNCRHQKYLIFSIASDVCFYPEQQEELANMLKGDGVSNIRVTVHSEKGHDSFLLEPELYFPHLSHALGEN